VDRDVDIAAETRQRLVDRVVDDLVDQMVQPRDAGRADVHGGTLADRLEAFENLDLVGAVVVHNGRRTGHGPGAAAAEGWVFVMRHSRCQILIGMMT
jgi:hypothetical protein